jgi:hypothetical protein
MASDRSQEDLHQLVLNCRTATLGCSRDFEDSIQQWCKTAMCLLRGTYRKIHQAFYSKKVYQAHCHGIRWTNLLHGSIAITCSFLHAIQQPAKPFHQGNATAIAHIDRVQQQNKIIDSEPKMK